MRVAFFVMRKGYFKYYASLIEHALAAGHEVSLLCDHTGRATPRRGYKSYEFPHLESMPTFVHGRPRLHAFTSVDELLAILRAEAAQVLFALGPTPLLQDFRSRAASRDILLAQLQPVPDPLIIADTALFDAIYGFSEHWPRWSIEYRLRHGLIPVEEVSRYAKDLDAAYVAAGFAEAEQLRYLDATASRARLGLPPERRILAYFPFPFVSIRHHGDFWPHRVYARARAVQYVNVLLSGRREFLDYPRNGWNDRRLIHAIRTFCDFNEALFVVKAREKNPIPRYLARAADYVVYDQAYYPATILDLLLASTLCVHFYSATMCEAVYAGAPNVCVSPSAVEWPIYARRMVVRDLSTEPESFYNFAGVTYSVGVGEFIERFGQTRFEDFPLDPVRRRAFIRRFLGHEDLRASERVFADLERRLGGHA